MYHFLAGEGKENKGSLESIKDKVFLAGEMGFLAWFNLVKVIMVFFGGVSID